MAVRILAARERQAAAWKNGGGVTREVAAYPPGAGLADFAWRVSFAEVGEGGPFSVFEGADRIITLVAGRGIEKGRQLWPNCGNACQWTGCLYEPLDVIQVVSDDRSVSVIDRGKHNETVDDVRMPGLSAKDGDISCMVLAECLNPAAADDVVQSVVTPTRCPRLGQHWSWEQWNDPSLQTGIVLRQKCPIVALGRDESSGVVDDVVGHAAGLNRSSRESVVSQPISAATWSFAAACSASVNCPCSAW
jgi:hypothetical protein